MAFERPSFKKLAIGALGVSACGLLAAAILTVACEDPHLRSDGGTPTNTEEGGCLAPAGQLPLANCDNSDHSCMSQPGCTIDQATCGSTSTCLPIGDNTGKTTLDFRLRRLNVIAPAPLAKQFIQAQVVTTNIDLNAKQCGEVGKGLFNWLMQIDTTANTIITGGAPPPTDAINQGFCFANFTTSDGIAISPINTGITFTGPTFKTTNTVPKLNIPIFLSPDIASAVVLPITNITLQNVTISADNNCIGSFNQEALDPSCFDDPSSCYKWNTAGALGGYITIKEADDVNIMDLGESLCVLLTGTTKDPNTGKCPQPLPQTGDYCSTSNGPATANCKDSFWLAATFAASAAKIFDGKGTVPACSGASATTDAGTDSGPTDGGTD